MTLKEKLQMDTNGLIAHGPVTIAFFGDSVTHGCFEDGVFDFDAVYHAKLARMLHWDYPTMPVNIINAGIGGITAKTSLPRLHRDVISHHPDLAVVCFGLNDVNDTVEEYTEALGQIFQALGAAGIPAVFLTPTLPGHILHLVGSFCCQTAGGIVSRHHQNSHGTGSSTKSRCDRPSFCMHVSPSFLS